MGLTALRSAVTLPRYLDLEVIRAKGRWEEKWFGFFRNQVHHCCENFSKPVSEFPCHAQQQKKSLSSTSGFGTVSSSILVKHANWSRPRPLQAGVADHRGGHAKVAARHLQGWCRVNAQAEAHFIRDNGRGAKTSKESNHALGKESTEKKKESAVLRIRKAALMIVRGTATSSHYSPLYSLPPTSPNWLLVTASCDWSPPPALVRHLASRASASTCGTSESFDGRHDGNSCPFLGDWEIGD